jgi:predicted aspartyl protease
VAAADLESRLTVPVLVNEQGPFPFIVDTGSNRTVVSDVLAIQLGLTLAGPIKVQSATGPATTDSVYLNSLSVGPRLITHIRAPVLKAKNLGALGMLGIDAVANQRIVLDFRRRSMSVTGSTRSENDPTAITVQARSKYRQLVLVDASVEGIPLYVVIDTGAEVTVGNLTLRETLARRRAAAPAPVTVISVTGDSIVADLSMMPRVRLGGVQVNNLQIAYADLYVFKQFGLRDKPSILLGMDTLRHFERVSVDFPAREVRFVLA